MNLGRTNDGKVQGAHGSRLTGKRRGIGSNFAKQEVRQATARLIADLVSRFLASRYSGRSWFTPACTRH
jgi:hypothetical protein